MRGVAVTIVVVLGALALLMPLALFTRVRTLAQRVGSFECALRTPSGWASGIAHYATDRIRWYRTMSFDPRPALEWRREELVVTEWEPREGTPPGGEGIVEVTFAVAPEPVVLAMSRAAYAGFASWLESAPPRERMT